MDTITASPGLTPLTKALLDQLPQGAILIDRAGAIQYANDIARSTVGRVIESVDGQSDALLNRLEALGGNRAELVADDARIGTVVFLPNHGPAVSLAKRERQTILSALHANGWRLAATAKQLGISRTTLWRRLKAYGIDRDGRTGSNEATERSSLAVSG